MALTTKVQNDFTQQLLAGLKIDFRVNKINFVDGDRRWKSEVRSQESHKSTE